MLFTKLEHVRSIILITGLAVSLCPGIFAVGTPTPQGRTYGAVCVRGKLLKNSPKGGAAKEPEAQLDLVIVEAPEVLRGPLPHRFPQGSRLVRLELPEQTPHNLTPGFFAAADPRTSFDGDRVLFAGKKSVESPWQIWEMNVDGTGARQVTHCTADCLKPAYLPRGEIVYTAYSTVPVASFAPQSVARSAVQSSAGSAIGRDATSQLWVAKVDGSDAHPITFGPGDFQVETVLRNGAILATARFPLLPPNGRPADRELYTLRPDGTGLATLRCEHQDPAVRSQAQELDDGAVVFVKALLTTRSLGGNLAWIRRGAMHNAPLTVPPISALSPQPLAAHELLVAREFPTGSAAGKQLVLCTFNAETQRFAAPLYQNPKFATVEAVPIAAHEAPRWYWSTLNPDLHRAYFICLDGYLAEGIPQGRISAKLTRVRVLKLDAASQREIVLGEAPVEEDGSFYIAVPPDTPLRFEELDGAGRVVRAQRSWIWSRSGEEHGCVGCHEDRAQAPENRWPLALRRFDAPIRLDLAKLPKGSD